jgi:hypothetical protein
MPSMVGAFSTNRSICCGTRRLADLCLLWRSMGLSPILAPEGGDRPESAASDAGERLFRTSRKSAPSISADKSMCGSAAGRTLAQVDRSKHPRWNLQATVRVGCSQVAAKDDAARPRKDHGCHGYSSSRNSVLWAFSSFVVQRDQAARLARVQTSCTSYRPSARWAALRRSASPAPMTVN